MSGRAWKEYRAGHARVSARLGALVLLGLVAGSTARAEVGSTAAAPPVQAVWVEHDVNFTYVGRTTYYSCDGLRDKVRYILEQVGARKKDLKVNVGCFNTSGVEFMPHVRIHAVMPTPATPEVLAQLATEAPKRELIARVKGSGEGTDAATAQFPATWNRVVFDGGRNYRVADGDCELFEQMVREVFVPLGVRVAPETRLTCLHHDIATGAVLVKVDRLARLPEPDQPPAH
jgi:hypothetical protein